MGRESLRKLRTASSHTFRRGLQGLNVIYPWNRKLKALAGSQLKFLQLLDVENKSPSEICGEAKTGGLATFSVNFAYAQSSTCRAVSVPRQLEVGGTTSPQREKSTKCISCLSCTTRRCTLKGSMLA